MKLTASSGEPIDLLRKVLLGGIEQTIHIRGRDLGNPLLLFIHGGPGLPHMPFAHLNADLEERFTVVQWDQRGAGKSFQPRLRSDDCHLERYIADAHQLVTLLRADIPERPIVIVGHSWGSIVGAFVASRFPELLAAYVGIGQVTHLPSAERERYSFATSMAHRFDDDRIHKTLARLGPPPYQNYSDSEELEALAEQMSAPSYRPPGRLRFLSLAVSSPTYSLLDVAKIPRGVRLCTKLLWTQIFNQVDLFNQLPRIDIPVFFLLGLHDRVVGHVVAKRYFDQLDAPKGKRFITFKDSGHWPHLEESARFRAILIEDVIPSIA